MHLRHIALRAAVGLVACCWVLAGPGGELLRVSVCRHAGMHMTSESGTSAASTPTHQGPCVCHQMNGGFDQTLSIAMLTPPLSPMAVEPVIRLAPRVPSSHSPSWSLAPQTRPPIAA